MSATGLILAAATVIVTERELPSFRARELSSRALLAAVVRDVRVVIRVAVGVGKSFAVDALLRDPRTFARFDLVVYSAPTWNVLNERPIVRGDEAPLIPHVVLRPRPNEDCGPYSEAWEQLEARSCGAFGKATLCRECQEGVPETERCFWPKQYSRLRGVGLIFTTEQNFLVNRSLLPFLIERTGAKRPLVILDEAKLLDANSELVVGRDALDRFQTLLSMMARGKTVPRDVARSWIETLAALRSASSEELSSFRPDLPAWLHRHAYEIQAAGIRAYGDDFGYVGYDLGQFQWSRAGERWYDDEGALHFVARPYLQFHTILLSAHLTAEYAAHRLGADSIASPHEKTRFVHTQSRVVNLCSRVGALRNFKSNHKQILDTIAVLVARNVAAGRTTLLVSRLKAKEFCANYLRDRVSGWGMAVRFEIEKYGTLPKTPDPYVIPVLHYGVVGINDFSAYETAYCLNSYYVPLKELNRVVQEAEPATFRVELGIETGPDRIRRVTVRRRENGGIDARYLGDLYLRKLEIDPAIQVVGRVRFLTLPREVAFFAMHDLAPDLGEVTVVRSLVELRGALGIPSAREIDERREGLLAQNWMAEGATADEVAARLGVGRRTVFNRLAALKSAESPERDSLRVFCTLGDVRPTSGASS